MVERRKNPYSPEQDPNWLAYKAEEAELKRDHMGEYVAYHNGQRIMFAGSYEELETKMFKEKGITGFMFHHIVDQEHVYHIRSPRRVS